jgi:hypothetical protein
VAETVQRQMAEDGMRLFTVSTVRIFRRKSSDIRNRILKRRVATKWDTSDVGLG